MYWGGWYWEQVGSNAGMGREKILEKMTGIAGISGGGEKSSAVETSGKLYLSQHKQNVRTLSGGVMPYMVEE